MDLPAPSSASLKALPNELSLGSTLGACLSGTGFWSSSGSASLPPSCLLLRSSLAILTVSKRVVKLCNPGGSRSASCCSLLELELPAALDAASGASDSSLRGLGSLEIGRSSYQL